MNIKDYSEAELFFASYLEKIASSRHLLTLLKRYLDEPDAAQRRLLAAEISLSIENRDHDPPDSG